MQKKNNVNLMHIAFKYISAWSAVYRHYTWKSPMWLAEVDSAGWSSTCEPYILRELLFYDDNQESTQVKKYHIYIYGYNDKKLQKFSRFFIPNNFIW